MSSQKVSTLQRARHTINKNKLLLVCCQTSIKICVKVLLWCIACNQKCSFVEFYGGSDMSI